MAGFRDGRNADAKKCEWPLEQGSPPPPGCGRVHGLAAQQEVSSGASKH